MCEACHRKEDQDVRFWRAVRRALIQIAKAIDTRYPEHRHDDRRAA